jgi:hypothetical protein
MLQEVEESTATLLPAAEQVLQELEEEARASWEEQVVYHAKQVTSLAGDAFETLSENRWSQRDCTEYQDENLPKGLLRARLVKYASLDAQGSSRPKGASQPRVSTGYEGCGETPLSSRRTTRGETSAGWKQPSG